jgi:death-on-curing protein
LDYEPRFLSRELIDQFHDDEIEAFGGAHGLRDEGALESALAAPQYVYLYRDDCDLFDIAAAYAYHIAESQAYFDGNKRTGVDAALSFLEMNGVETDALPEEASEKAMLAVARHELDRAGLAQFFRKALGSATSA